MENLLFKNQTVLISGGASGIGYFIAKRYLSLEANVVICGRTESKLKKAIKSLKSYSKNDVIGIRCDMSLEIDVKKMFEKVINIYGVINIFINNSAVWFLKNILDIEEKDIDYAYNNILKSTILGTKISAKYILKNSNGSIINISSFAGLMAQKDASLYACFKSAIISFTKSSAAELADFNIRVNCVTPGVIRTDMTSDYIDLNIKNILKPIALNRIGDEEEVVDGIIFLTSKYSKYITGENLCITGGKYLIQE
tara:strand:- start:235 stop:996 length:762 start_codon:yes stop_codon:yes gene_type:complete